MIPAGTEDTSSITSDNEYLNNQNNNTWKSSGYQTGPTTVPVSKSHQFITGSSQTNSQFDKPEWQHTLIERRRTAAVD
ncbi:unnamed protein product [Rotaria sp. Silwood1]|nr:unnamed protein product [Rotaria sp. Silwood1]